MELYIGSVVCTLVLNGFDEFSVIFCGVWSFPVVYYTGDSSVYHPSYLHLTNLWLERRPLPTFPLASSASIHSVSVSAFFPIKNFF